MSTETETALVKASEGMALTALTGSPDIDAAVDAAKYAISIVVTDAISAQQADEALVRLARGSKALDAAKKPLTSLTTRIRDAINGTFSPKANTIAQASDYLREQKRGWLLAEQRKADEARRKADAEAARIAREDADRRFREEQARREAAAAGLPAPTPDPVDDAPPAQEYVPSVATKSKTGDGGGTHMTTDIREADIEDASQCPLSWLSLNKRDALLGAKAALAAGDVECNKRDGASFVFRGVRFTYRSDIAVSTKR